MISPQGPNVRVTCFRTLCAGRPLRGEGRVACGGGSASGCPFFDTATNPLSSTFGIGAASGVGSELRS